jgi:hypothetical protein
MLEMWIIGWEIKWMVIVTVKHMLVSTSWPRESSLVHRRNVWLYKKLTAYWAKAWCLLLNEMPWKIRWNENKHYFHLVQDRVHGLSLMNTKYSFVSTVGNVLIRWLKECASWSKVTCQSFVALWGLIVKRLLHICLAIAFILFLDAVHTEKIRFCNYCINPFVLL